MFWNKKSIEEKKKVELTPKVIVIKIVRIIVISYFTMMIFLYFNQKKMLYYPDYPRAVSFSECYNFEKDEQKEYNGTRFYEKKGENNNVIVFFHGNAGRACDREAMKNILGKTGNSIIFVEYFGYSNHSGNKPNIKNILQDTLNIGEYLKAKNFDNIYVVGRSIGTGPASYFTKNFNIDKLLLISPYSQLYKVASDKYPYLPIKLMFTENYNSEEYLKNYKNDLLIIHGNRDEVVPFSLGKELYLGVNTEKKEFVEVNDGDHNDILYATNVADKIGNFLIKDNK